MEITKLSEDFAICGQIYPSDLEEIKRMGFQSLICVRPDGEAEDQPPFAEIDRSARVEGLSSRYVPVDPSGATEENRIAFARALTELPGPILGYCRSGQRAAKLWQAQQDTSA